MYVIKTVYSQERERQQVFVVNQTRHSANKRTREREADGEGEGVGKREEKSGEKGECGEAHSGRSVSGNITASAGQSAPAGAAFHARFGAPPSGHWTPYIFRTSRQPTSALFRPPASSHKRARPWSFYPASKPSHNNDDRCTAS